MVLIEAVDENLHLFALDRNRRRCHEHAVFAIEVECLFRRRLHADNRDIITVAHLADRYRRRRVAGDDDGLDTARHEKIKRLLHKAHDLFLRLDAIGYIVLIGIKHELFLRQYAHRMVKNGKSANP